MMQIPPQKSLQPNGKLSALFCVPMSYGDDIANRQHLYLLSLTRECCALTGRSFSHIKEALFSDWYHYRQKKGLFASHTTAGIIA